MIRLANQSVDMQIDTARGGGVTRFDWHGYPVFRRADTADSGPLGLSCFAMAPFCNRIEDGRFSFAGKSYTLPVNCPAASEHHAIHGQGWQSLWEAAQIEPDYARITYHQEQGDWPWAYSCEQTFQLTATGYEHGLAIENRAEHPMPAGLGLHPYFPAEKATIQTRFAGHWAAATGEICDTWQSATEPPELTPRDDCHTGRVGDLIIAWPRHTLTITPDYAFQATHVFVPDAENWFCVEPVSHLPDALNRGTLRVIDPGDVWRTTTKFSLDKQA